MKSMMFGIALAFALMLTGCAGDRENPVPETIAPTPAPTAEVSVTQPSTEAPVTQPSAEAMETRPAKTDFPVMKEGTADQVSMELWDRPEYSLYFPEYSMWYLELDRDDTYPEDSWESALNPLLSFTVYHLGQTDLRGAEQFLVEEEDDMELSIGNGVTYTGVDWEDMESLYARFCPSDRGNYLLVAKFPFEATEGFGEEALVMMDTFMIK